MWKRMFDYFKNNYYLWVECIFVGCKLGLCFLNIVLKNYQKIGKFRDCLIDGKICYYSGKKLGIENYKLCFFCL